MKSTSGIWPGDPFRQDPHAAKCAFLMQTTYTVLSHYAVVDINNLLSGQISKATKWTLYKKLCTRNTFKANRLSNIQTSFIELLVQNLFLINSNRCDALHLTTNPLSIPLNSNPPRQPLLQ